MISITLTTHDDEKLEIVEYEILAWLSWPFEWVFTGCRKLMETVELMRTGSCLVASQEWGKELLVPAGELRNPSRHQVIKGTSFPPVRRCWRYEERTDYVGAVVDGIGSTMVCRGRMERRHR